MTKQKPLFRPYDVVWIQKVHDNQILNTYSSLNQVDINQSNLVQYIKPRPALIIRVFVSKTNLKRTKYLIVPLTTSDSIRKWKDAEDFCRLYFPYANKESWLMVDSLSLIDRKAILNIYRLKDGNNLNLSRSQRTKMFKSLKHKYNKIFTQ